MNLLATGSWHEVNQRSLMTALAQVREALERHAARERGNGTVDPVVHLKKHEQEKLVTSANNLSAPPALDTLCAAFDLTPFERDVLLLCAGMELDSSFTAYCANAQSEPRRANPTFSLALAALPEAHWSALTPVAPLRRWRLIEVGAGETLVSSPLRIDERILHYLAGVPYGDERVEGLIERPTPPLELPPSHRALVERIHRLWSPADSMSALPAIQLCGEDHIGKRGIAAAACAGLGLNLSLMSANVVPLEPAELDAMIRLWEREAALSASTLFLDCNELDASDAPREKAISRFIETTHAALFVASRERRQVRQRPVITFDVCKSTATEQRDIWRNVLGAGTPHLNGPVDALVSQFSLSVPTIHAAYAEALGAAELGARKLETSPDRLSDALWDACRTQARPRLESLAQRIESRSDWNDLALPTPQLQTLHEISAQVRQRLKVYETWGFAAKNARGLGISVLFTGPSGVGKTLAAEVLTNELRLDLYRIDLSSIVSKYIGDTEKNLRRVFDAAEEGGAVLLFDEADALFGKRSEVKDSHDRYANIEVSYLLQRMEAYRSLAILTTNMKGALDPAFLRRIRFIVQFPFPDAAQRAEIWRRIFPANTPTEGLDLSKLARLNVTGGNIRNIALNGAFLAADAGEPVRMTHLLRAARSEYSKLEKPLTEGEIGSWV